MWSRPSVPLVALPVQTPPYLPPSSHRRLDVDIVDWLVQVVHRDLKPENFLFKTKDPIDQNSLKVIDFGLAKAMRQPLTELTLPATLTSIGDRAFAGCSSLTSLTFPESLTRVAKNMFEDCIGLTSLAFPDR